MTIPSVKLVSQEAPSLGPELMDPVTFYNSDASDSGTGGSAASFDSAENSAMAPDYGNMEPPTQTGSPVHACSASLKDWNLQVSGHESSFTGRAGVSPIEIPTFSTASSFADRDAHNVSDCVDNLYVDFPNSETEEQCRHVGEDVDSKYPLYNPFFNNFGVNSAHYGALAENSLDTFRPPQENIPCSYMGISLGDADLSSQNVTSTESTICQSSDVISNFTDHYSPMQYYMATDGTFDFSRHHLPSSYSSQFSMGNPEMMINTKDEIGEFSNESASSSSKVILNGQRGIMGRSVSEVSMPNQSYFLCEGNNYMSSISGNSSSDTENCSIDDKASKKLLICTQSYLSSKDQATCVKDEATDEFIAPSSHSMEVIDEAVSRKSSYSADAKLCVDKDVTQSSGISHSQSIQKHIHVKHEKEDVVIASKRACHSQDIASQIVSRFPPSGGHLNSSALEQYVPCAQPSILSKIQLDCIKGESETKLVQSKTVGSHLSEVTLDLNCKNFSGKYHVEDSDICIIEDMSHPPPTNYSPAIGNSLITSQHSTFSDSVHSTGVGGTRIKSDERYILRVALQDLSQPKSEASPPDGDLAVSLLRHQRIALSWMVQKETASFHCSGGILADDQGLGKTVSTIALILKERPPSFRAYQNVKQGKLETLNLDEDDDVPPALNGMKQDAESLQMTSNTLMKSVNSLVQTKGRPSAGTLIVCPTSVLRQWAEELNSKVTSKANLSVLVYHGSNRTKDPYELAKYDVVLTTYSIVSMEVPKQSLVDEDDDERGKLEDDTGFSSGRKRKCPSSDKKCSKNKKGLDSALLESAARPLAKVAWFRVVLDEAQSIKNHRTQVARACWGLRAKRRWCLSGTPIQNAIDDLYSYFRFLRYDPYAQYTSFCSTIKVPINRSPSKGYKKLQAVLKTIMLRRTKDTLLDGEPIINLPPKFIELKKVDFSDEERNFYSKLEADSRAQFQEYADAGTVKQNYVNILLMLLRLRQACDHPLLVRPYDSSSLWRSSVEMAKKLPQEKQIWLLDRLEASQAICGVCNDPPEDAVVSICDHVFCHQCISEHLTGDDKQCPVTNCKVRLFASSVFSKATLNSSLSDEPGQDGSPNCSVSEVVDAAELFYGGNSYGSSTKIKAALEVLHSLCKPQGCSLGASSAQSTLDENAICHNNSDGELCEDNADRQHLAVERSSNNSVKVVGEKAIVFSQWTRMLDLLEACLKNSSIQYRRLDGTMSVLARDKAVKDFNTLPEVSVMIMSLKAASLGLNMVAACHVLLLDLWWNPTTEDQAIDRAHRIGQTRPVTVLRLTVRDTVEDRILALQQKKREMVAAAFGEDGTGGRQTRLTVEDLKYLFMM
ncbi:helicase-like transcription factor CHR28 isoform X2 [Quercus lobata]|uniref:helicase-like transcription factor CHR28 isoform X2 n=1 Tax=Quercus lobata TaxID=97700 RepID=UPI0012443C52|nr:helicase-like transcription factor CHR28 isoform X2 [Quercus lobata]XP_030967711.1 helicase-like transcription factor CHR28 isoform X2 [Quercus lobata]